MKFRVTATSLMYRYEHFGEHTKRLLQKYPKLIGKVQTEQVKSVMQPETIIEIKDLNELLSLVSDGSGIVVYKVNYFDKETSRQTTDDKYTIEIYDDYRE